MGYFHFGRGYGPLMKYWFPLIQVHDVLVSFMFSMVANGISVSSKQIQIQILFKVG